MADYRSRLMKGAEILGNLWREGFRCPEGWRAVECSCEPRNKFCKAKKQWVDLALLDGRMLEEGDLGIPFMMTRAAEWDATGLKLRVDIKDHGEIYIGRGGAITMAELARTTPESLPSILKVMKCFPGSQVTDNVFAGVPAEPEVQFPEKKDANRDKKPG